MDSVRRKHPIIAIDTIHSMYNSPNGLSRLAVIGDFPNEMDDA